MLQANEPGVEEKCFLELRRKVRESEMLSASMERLLLALRFSGKLNITVQNGRVVKSAYEEGYSSNRSGSHGSSRTQ